MSTFEEETLASDLRAREEMSKGAQVRAMLEHPLFAAAFAELEQELITQWRNNPELSEAGREKAWMMLQMLDRVKANLISYVETGHLAELELRSKKEHQSMLERIAAGASFFKRV